MIALQILASEHAGCLLENESRVLVIRLPKIKWFRNDLIRQFSAVLHQKSSLESIHGSSRINLTLPNFRDKFQTLEQEHTLPSMTFIQNRLDFIQELVFKGATYVGYKTVFLEDYVAEHSSERNFEYYTLPFSKETLETQAYV